MQIKLQIIVDEIESQTDDYNKYLDTQSGQVICVETEDFRIAEESETEDDFSKYPVWQQTAIKQAMDVLVNCFSDKYIMLPTVHDINEYNIIEEFCGTVQNCRIRDSLYSAIRGNGAFRKFKDAIYRYEIEDLWYKFRKDAFMKVAIKWCERNKISYLDDASGDVGLGDEACNMEEDTDQKFSISDQLKILSPIELVKLIMELIQRGEQPRLHVLEWLDENFDKAQKSDNSKRKSKAPKIHDELLLEYWCKAQDIISEFNCYGGGSDEDEEDAYHWLDKIADLISENKITSAAKYKFLDEAFIEYDAGNSGFDDSLMDLFFSICKEKEEWEYLVKKLHNKPSEWNNRHIMNIYKDHLNDNDKYLDVRLKNLHSGLDYWDLVEYYSDMEKNDLALETALKGMRKGEGRLTEIYDYLINYYSKKQDEKNLEIIAKTSIERKIEAKYVLDKLFEYYKNLDYEKAKEKLFQSYQNTNYKKYFEEYKIMKEYLSEADWDKIEPDIFCEAQKGNLHDYMNICLYKGMKDEVIKMLVSSPDYHQGYNTYTNFDLFAGKLEKDYPNEILAYYSKKAYSRISNGDRKTYKEAVKYLEKVKSMCLKYLKDADKWTLILDKLKSEFKNRPAFIDEVRKSKL